MKRLARIVGSLACLLLPLFEAGAEVDPLASRAAEEFLKGLTLIDLPEGKALFKRNSWPQWVSFPVLLKYETLFEGMFETDVPAIKGYKRLIDAEIQSKAKTALRERYLVVVYSDQRTAVWKVLVFSSGTDVQWWVRWAESYLGDTKSMKPQFRYRWLAFWYAAARRLKDSYVAYQKAAELNRKSLDKSTPQSEFDQSAEAIASIMGGRPAAAETQLSDSQTPNPYEAPRCQETPSP